jgi:spore germination protein KC
VRKIKSVLVFMVVIFTPVWAAGCWNYREIDDLAIVAGMAIDKSEDERYSMTVEIVEFSGQQEAREVSRVVTIEGRTIFDTARNGIAVLGKKLYWSHTHAVIVNEKVAEEGIIKVIDWFARDAETRADVNIFVSRGQSAKDVLKAREDKAHIKAFELREMIDNQQQLAKAPQIEIWEIANRIASKGTAAIAPVIELEKVDGRSAPRISGTAVFKGDKLIGFMDEEETKDMLFIQDEIKGGLLITVARENKEKEEVPMALEIFKSKTKVKPRVQDGNINFKVDIETTVALAELEGTEDYIDETKRKQLEESVEKAMEERIGRLIKKVQQQYGTDIFGFGDILRRDKVKAWHSLGGNWEDKFENMRVDVTVKVHIKNSAILSKPLEAGE